MSSHDVIVVGAGSAGCVIASRLSADPSVRVLLIEAGARNSHRHPQIRAPLAWHPASESKRFGWGYSTEPEPASANRVLHQPRGKMLGGTSSINGMMYSRGSRGDYDGWARQGLDGWDYNSVLPYFRRSESNWRGESEYHGGAGPMRVSKNPREPVIYPVMIETARRLGHREVEDFHGASQEGFGMPDFTTRGGRRESSATAFLIPALRRPNLTVMTDSQVLRVRLEGTKATGVDYAQDGLIKHAAAGEVILCGGAFGSPQMLLLSGIGAPDDLRAAGVTVRHELPAVGRNLQDHPLVPAVFEAARPFQFEKLLRLDRLAVSSLRWLATGRGPIGEAPVSVQGFVRLQQASEYPDTQFQVSHVSFMARPWFPGWRPGAGHQFTAAAMQLRPHGRGRVSLRSSDPFAAPCIRLGLMEAEADRLAAREMFQFIRTFFSTRPVADLIAREVFPGAAVNSTDEMDAFLRNTLQTGMHPAGSCAMGVDPSTSVVDGRLRVHGLSGLWVADASVMPCIVSGNTHAATVMIGEKAADLVINRV